MHTVLLVDDEIYARKGLRNLIDWNTYSYEVVDEANNGEDALHIIKQTQPDLVITDIRMPVLDGLELIRKVIEEEVRKPSFIIISGFDDFNYAQKAVRYGVHDFILKPIDEHELKATLVKLSDKLRQEKWLAYQKEQAMSEGIIEALIKGEFSDTIIPEWAEQLKVAPEGIMYYAFIEFNDDHPWQTRQALSLEEKKKSILKGIKHLMKESKPIYLYEHRGRFGLLLPKADFAADLTDVGQLGVRLQNILSDKTGYPVYVYIGRKINKLSDLRDSFQTAKEALQYKYMMSDSKVVVFDEVCGESMNYMHIDQDLFRQLVEQIEKRDKQQLATIDIIFRDFQVKRFVPEAIKAAISQFVHALIEIIKRMEGNEKELNSFEAIVSWHDMNLSLDELKRLFIQFVTESGGLMERLRTNIGKGGIQKIKSYVEERFYENINLKKLAAEFYINPVYLGQLFKKTYGVYFNEFLLDIRINEAKKLLRQTDLRIYEIAEKVGFKNADYFVTQFEKLENMTPSEYRNQWL